MDRLEKPISAILDWAGVSPLRTALVILAVGLVVLVPGLAEMPVTDRDEARFAQATKQMLETGDLVDIRFQDQPRWKKPAGIYWLQAGSASLFGGVEAPIWAYRMPSVLAALLTALLTAWAARPLIGPRGAVLAGLMMVTTVLMVVEGHIAKTDAALTASATAGLGAMAHLLLGQGGRGTALTFWLAIAAAILLKGPIVPGIVLLCLTWFWVFGRQRPAFGRFYPLPGLVLVVVLVAPWLIAIWQVSDGAFFAEALGRDLGAKLTSGQEKHWGPPGLYFGLVWGTLWPWAALIPVAAVWLWQNRREDWLRLLAGWVIPFWLVLEIVPTKLPHYVLPLYPALVIALAGAMLGGASAARPWLRKLGAVLVAVPGFGLSAGVVVIPLLLSSLTTKGGEALIPSTVSVPALMLAAAALVFVVLAVRAAWTGQAMAQIGALVMAAVLIYPAVLQFGLPNARGAFPSPAMAEMIARYRPCATGPAFSIGYREPSLVFLTETGLGLTDPETALAAFTNDPGAMLLIEDRWRDMLGEKIPPSVTRERLAYFNYNRGKTEAAALLTSDDPRWDACAKP